MFLTSLQKLSSNVGDLGKLIVAKGFKKLPKMQKIAQSGHTGGWPPNIEVCSFGETSWHRFEQERGGPKIKITASKILLVTCYEF